VGERLAEREADTITVDKGAIVMDRDGDHVGVVGDVLLDGQTSRLEGFVLRVGGPLRDWAA
jgi:sporulation protein YlmC with PRC-barrel domain